MEALLQELQKEFDKAEQEAWKALHAGDNKLYDEMRGRVSGIAHAMNSIRDKLDEIERKLNTYSISEFKDREAFLEGLKELHRVAHETLEYMEEDKFDDLTKYDDEEFYILRLALVFGCYMNTDRLMHDEVLRDASILVDRALQSHIDLSEDYK